jgi:hypothetical protein
MRGVEEIAMKEQATTCENWRPLGLKTEKETHRIL